MVFKGVVFNTCAVIRFPSLAPATGVEHRRHRGAGLASS